jgi:retinol dehydrogenase-12
MRMTFGSFVRSQWKKLPPNPNIDLSSQTVLVTGSNTGLGLEAAKQFARMNPAHLVLAVRNLAKGQEALSGERPLYSRVVTRVKVIIADFSSPTTELQKETGYKGGNVMKLDQGDFVSVSAFVTEFEKQHDRLDVFVANAGINTLKYSATKDGHESTSVLLP